MKKIIYSLTLFTFIITITNCASDTEEVEVQGNDSPTNITLSENTILAKEPLFTVVGVFETSDLNAEDKHSYKFVEGPGDEDNGKFTLVGDTLKTNVIFEYGVKASYWVRIETNDGHGGTFEKLFGLFVKKNTKNILPTNISLDNLALRENNVPNTTIGLLSTEDQNTDDTHTYSILPKDGSDDHKAFVIVDDTLKAAISLDYETQASYKIEIETKDNDGAGFKKEFEITVINNSGWELVSTAPWDGRTGMSVVAFDNKVWMSGGDHDGILKNDVWSSADGKSWIKVTEGANWARRQNHHTLAFDNKLWLIGGTSEGSSGAVLNSDVWFSTDGDSWTEATTNTGWGDLSAYSTASFAGKMWAMGGEINSVETNKIWASSDGIQWKEISTNPPVWDKRIEHTTTTFNNRIWVLAGKSSSGDRFLNDAWNSVDGESWKSTSNSVRWADKDNLFAVGDDTQIHVIGGGGDSGNHMHWTSQDGTNWNEDTHSAAWTTESINSAFLFKNRLCIMTTTSKGSENKIWCLDP